MRYEIEYKHWTATECRFDPDAKIKAMDVFEAFRAWAEKHRVGIILRHEMWGLIRADNRVRRVKIKGSPWLKGIMPNATKQ